VCSLRGTDWVFNYNSDSHTAQCTPNAALQYFHPNVARTSSKFRHDATLQTQNSTTNPQLLTCDLHTNTPLPITLPPSLPPTLYLVYRLPFTRRTSGPSLQTFTERNPALPRSNSKCGTSYCILLPPPPPLSLCLKTTVL
jgi:hypothetical protein